MPEQKVALITGLAGQDGSYMAELLLSLDYRVYGMVRRKGGGHNELGLAWELAEKVNVMHGDVTDSEQVKNVVFAVEPDEVYHFAAQSHVGESFGQPSVTMRTNADGTFNMLQACADQAKRGMEAPIKFYNACSSEMFGKVDLIIDPIQDEETRFKARSPYGVSKIAQFHWGELFRENYQGVDVWNGITFNHESERRPADFVSRKVTQYVASLTVEQVHVMGKEAPLDIPTNMKLKMGNMEASRDWGYAPDYCEAFHAMLQMDTTGDDFVVATGTSRTVKDLLQAAFQLGGFGDWKAFVEEDPRFMRPSDVPYLCGDATLLTKATGWKPRTPFSEMLSRMIDTDRRR